MCEPQFARQPSDVCRFAFRRRAQAVIDTLVTTGVRAILNYAPIAARIPPGVHVRHIDPVLALQSMTYYLKAHEFASAK